MGQFSIAALITLNVIRDESNIKLENLLFISMTWINPCDGFDSEKEIVIYCHMNARRFSLLRLEYD